MYLPLIAVIVLTVALLARLKPRSTVAAVVILACAAALGAGSVARNRDYQSALRLARTTVERRPTSVARHALATELLNAGAADEAMVHLRQAVAGAPRARFTLGVQTRRHFLEWRWCGASVTTRPFRCIVHGPLV
jgi:hypothetical protein